MLIAPRFLEDSLRLAGLDWDAGTTTGRDDLTAAARTIFHVRAAAPAKQHQLLYRYTHHRQAETHTNTNSQYTNGHTIIKHRITCGPMSRYRSYAENDVGLFEGRRQKDVIKMAVLEAPDYGYSTSLFWIA